MLSARQNAFLRSCITASLQKADTQATATFPDPREKPAARPTVTVPKSREAIPRFIVQTFRNRQSECDPFHDLGIAQRHAALNAPSYIWPADSVTVKDGVVSHRMSVKPLHVYS